MAREFVERDGYRGRDVPGRVFLLGPHIDNRDMPGPDPFKQLGSRAPTFTITSVAGLFGIGGVMPVVRDVNGDLLFCMPFHPNGSSLHRAAHAADRRARGRQRRRTMRIDAAGGNAGELRLGKETASGPRGRSPAPLPGRRGVGISNAMLCCPTVE